MGNQQSGASWARLIELAILLSLAAMLYALYVLNYLDRILDNPLTVWFFAIIVIITSLVEVLAFTGRDVDVHFWSWLTTGFGMLGTVLGFSMALGGIDAEALQNPAALSAEIGKFLKTVSFAIDTTLTGLSAAMIMEAMDKLRTILRQSRAG